MWYLCRRLSGRSYKDRKLSRLGRGFCTYDPGSAAAVARVVESIPRMALAQFGRFAICRCCSGSVSVDGIVGGCARGEPSAVLPAARVRHFPAVVGARPLLPMIFVVEDLQFATLLPSPPSSCRCGWSPATGSRSRRTTLYCRPADSTATVEKSDGGRAVRAGREVRSGRKNLCAAVPAKTALQAAAEAIFGAAFLTIRLREADMCAGF